MAAPGRAAGMPSLGGSWLGGGKGAEKHRPLRNFDFFCLRSQKEHFMNSTAKATPDLSETDPPDWETGWKTTPGRKGPARGMELL